MNEVYNLDCFFTTNDLENISMECLAYLVWDPSRVCFKIPFIGYPITWYGCLFALGFMLGHIVVRHVLTAAFQTPERTFSDAKERASSLLDRFGILGALSAVIGARIGYILFYGLPEYIAHPIEIFKVWEGGLASHGAALFVLVAIIYFVRRQKRHFPELTFLFLLDALTIAATLAGGCIRIGNFINQEITGITTSLPWAVVFLHPMDNVAGVPLHPVQLYESLFYFVLFVALYTIWRARGKEIGSGFISGCFFLLLFTFRFCVEFIKIHQGHLLGAGSALRMGQCLSIPFVILGAVLVVRAWLTNRLSHEA
ncbi:MAG: prolipoprotein diacylglyceryl transferase [Chlamydiales bacterium]